MMIESKYDFGDIVYLKIDPDQKERMVVGFNIRPGVIQYALTSGNGDTWHYDIEISEEKNVLAMVKS